MIVHKLFRPTLLAATLAAFLPVLASLAGCMASTPLYDKQFGDAVRTVRAMQTLNPDASNPANPGASVDGRTATAAMDRYNGSFRAPQGDANGYTVGVGSANGGGSSGLNSMGR
ncbi:hypothetical protein [Cupriavidus sp. DL-D2]|uniref:hypothetical protein n=1 Tax=Cupriavidus sp. DL-D2 TaxID=3144974 RepID=UPI0032126A17